MNFVDLIVFIIILFFMMKCYKLGFIMASLKFVHSIISIIMAYMLQPVAVNFIKNTDFYENIKQNISKFLNIDNIFSGNYFESQYDLINSINIPDFLKNFLIDNNNQIMYDTLNVNNIKDYIIEFISSIFINMLSFIVLFIVCSILFSVIIGILDIFSKIPIINFINKSLGLIIGFLQGLIFVWILFIIVTFLNFSENFSEIFNMINESKIGYLLYNNNILLLIVSKVIKLV